MAQPEPRTRLEQLVRGATMTVADFMDGYAAAAAEIGETATVSEPQARRWLRGCSSSPLPIARRVLQHWWKESAEQLLGPPDHGTASVVPIVELSEEEMIVKAGRDSVEHAVQAASALDPSALEQLHAEARRAANAYYVTPSFEMFTDLMRLRNVVYTQLDRIEKPRQKAELYLIAGQVSGLLSSVSWDLGYPRSRRGARTRRAHLRIGDRPSVVAGMGASASGDVRVLVGPTSSGGPYRGRRVDDGTRWDRPSPFAFRPGSGACVDWRA